MKGFYALLVVLLVLFVTSASAGDLRPWQAFVDAKRAANDQGVPVEATPAFMIARLGPMPWRFAREDGVVEISGMTVRPEPEGCRQYVMARAHVALTWKEAGQGITAEDVAVRGSVEDICRDPHNYRWTPYGTYRYR